MDEAGVTLASAYKALGITPAADLKEVKAAYRRLALQCHPDLKNTKDNGEFRRLTAAYQRIIRRSPEEEPFVPSPAEAKAKARANRKARDAAAGYRYEVHEPLRPIMKTVFNNRGVVGVGVAISFMVAGSILVFLGGRVYSERYPEPYKFTTRRNHQSP